MSVKERLIAMIHELPDDVTAEVALENLAFRLHVEEGLQDADNGNVLSHEEFKQLIAARIVRTQVDQAIQQIENGEGIPHDEAKRRIGKWLS